MTKDEKKLQMKIQMDVIGDEKFYLITGFEKTGINTVLLWQEALLSAILGLVKQQKEGKI